MSTLLIDLASYELQNEEIEMLSHPLVAGVILFSRNFHDRTQLQALIQSIRHQVKKPLLITVDQEGGRVQRFRDGFTQLPAMQSFTYLLDDPSEQRAMAKETGWQMAAEITALDIDLSFAPVLDLGHECKAIGDRSFSGKIEAVIHLAEAFIQGMKQAGIASTGKHFPGHGHVLADSHLETPFDKRESAVIFNYDLQPFKQLIANKMLDAVMPAHVVYSQCDSQPASGSSYWLKNVLRQQLGFKGTIFSDDLGMKGANFMGNFVERSEKALNAGCDLLLLCNERDGVIEVLDHFKPTESMEQTALRQRRLAHLFKRQTRTWSDLEKSNRWLVNHKKLSTLQQQWLEYKSTLGL